MSIVRLGLSEKDSCAEGYEAIFGKKKAENKKTEEKKADKEDKSDKAKKGKKK